MAERPENRIALALLERLDAARLREASAWFAGGTAVSLRCGEFRVSRDVDFLCASNDGYRELRARVRGDGARGLFHGVVDLLREPRVDRYGIRLALGFGDVALKLEIVSEGRISLAGTDDPALPVARLVDDDLVAEKLLANDDRYLDDSALGRDAVDLLMLERTFGGLSDAAWAKARAAYGASVDRAWDQALRRMRVRPDLLARALDAMGVTAEARAVVSARLATLSDDEV